MDVVRDRAAPVVRRGPPAEQRPQRVGRRRREEAAGQRTVLGGERRRRTWRWDRSSAHARPRTVAGIRRRAGVPVVAGRARRRVSSDHARPRTVASIRCRAGVPVVALLIRMAGGSAVRLAPVVRGVVPVVALLPGVRHPVPAPRPQTVRPTSIGPRVRVAGPLVALLACLEDPIPARERDLAHQGERGAAPRTRRRERECRQRDPHTSAIRHGFFLNRRSVPCSPCRFLLRTPEPAHAGTAGRHGQRIGGYYSRESSRGATILITAEHAENTETILCALCGLCGDSSFGCGACLPCLPPACRQAGGRQAAGRPSRYEPATERPPGTGRRSRMPHRPAYVNAPTRAEAHS